MASKTWIRGSLVKRQRSLARPAKRTIFPVGETTAPSTIVKSPSAKETTDAPSMTWPAVSMGSREETGLAELLKRRPCPEFASRSAAELPDDGDWLSAHPSLSTTNNQLSASFFVLGYFFAS